MPLPAGLVDTSFSFIQVGLNALVLSVVMDRVEVLHRGETDERRRVFRAGTPGLTGEKVVAEERLTDAESGGTHDQQIIDDK